MRRCKCNSDPAVRRRHEIAGTLRNHEHRCECSCGCNQDTGGYGYCPSCHFSKECLKLRGEYLGILGLPFKIGGAS